jgi:hypothetical protein
LTVDESARIERLDHLMHDRWRDSEESLQIGFGWRSPVDLRVVIDVREILPLLRRERLRLANDRFGRNALLVRGDDSGASRHRGDCSPLRRRDELWSISDPRRGRVPPKSRQIGGMQSRLSSVGAQPQTAHSRPSELLPCVVTSYFGGQASARWVRLHHVERRSPAAACPRVSRWHADREVGSGQPESDEGCGDAAHSATDHELEAEGLL